MFKNIFINNFRCFNNASFDLSRVNILIGENSSGKSSFIKFLLALKQTIENRSASNLMLNGELVDLGNYYESVSRHKEEESISFSFTFDKDVQKFFNFFHDLSSRSKEKEEQEEIWKERLSKNQRIIDLNEEALKAQTEIKFTLNKELDTQTSISTTITNDVLGELTLAIESFNPTLKLKDNILSIVYKRKKNNDTIILQSIRYDKKGFLSIIEPDDLRREISRLKLDDNFYYEISIFLLTQNIVELNLFTCEYLNPINSKPQRFYYKKDIQNSYKEANLEKIVNSVVNKKVDDQTLAEFSRILASFGIAEELEFKEAKELPVAEIRVKVNSLMSNINDVGYGVSLQIPILFEAFISEKNTSEGSFLNSIFFIEQPEVHLHPSLQARFIKTLLEMGEENRYIIETHSEYIVRMLQVLVKTGELDADDVRIYYFQKGTDGACITKHLINKDGHLDQKFPEGFFDNSYKLTKSLMF